MNENSGTVTAPIYADIVVAGMFVLTALTIIVVVHAAVQKVRTARVQVNGLLAVGLTEGDTARREDETEERCCPSPQAAARNLCYCWGSGPGQWIGSAS